MLINPRCAMEKEAIRVQKFDDVTEQHFGLDRTAIGQVPLES